MHYGGIPVLKDDRFVVLMAMLILGVALFLSPPQGMALTLPEVIAAAQEVYDKTDDLQADFRQEAVIKSVNKTDREEGVFYYKKPRRMVWAYTKPQNKKMIINPQTAWLYIPADNIVYVQNAAEIFKGTAIIRFLAGWGKLTEDFTITFAGPEGMDREGNFSLRLVPKERDFGIDVFFLALNRDTFQISRISFTDSYGNETRVSFRNIKTNNRPAERFFTFIPPAGVEIQK